MRVTRKSSSKHSINKKKDIESALDGLLGEGFHGKIYRLDPHLKGQTLNSLYANKRIIKIKLYTDDHTEEIYLTEQNDISDFLAFLLTRKGVIAKVFKSTFLMTGVTKQQELENELFINKKVMKYYGSAASRFLTIAPIKGFRNYKIVGCYIETAKDGTLFIAFGSECDNNYSMNIHKMAVDILESLVHLQEAGYQHNDIKLDNVVRCGGKYKLIDWGQACSIEEFKFGDMMCTNPLKWYIKGIPAYFSQHFMDYRVSMVNSGYEKSSVFQEKNKQIIEEFKSIVSSKPDLHELNKKYKRNFDVFMLGMTMLHAVYKFNLKYERYQELIGRMTSLTHPWTSAKEALNYTKKYLDRVQTVSKSKN